MKNPFNAIRRCEELTYENMALKTELRGFETTKALLEKKRIEVEQLQTEADQLRKTVKDLTEKNHRLQEIAANGCDPEKEETIRKQEESITKLLEQLKASEQGRERAVKKLCAANKENKMLLHVNAKLADHLHRPAFKSSLKEQEEEQ